MSLMLPSLGTLDQASLLGTDLRQEVAQGHKRKLDRTLHGLKPPLNQKTRHPSRERVACLGSRGRDCIRAMQGHMGLVHLSTKLGQFVIHQHPQLNYLAFGRCAPFPFQLELCAVLVGPGLRLSKLGPEHVHQFAQRYGFPGRLSDRLYGWLNTRLHGRMNGRARLLALWKLDQGPPVIPALVTPVQASCPLPGRFGRDTQSLAGLLVGQPFSCDTPTLRPFMLSGLFDPTYGPLSTLQTDSLKLGRARTHNLRRAAVAVAPTRPPTCPALCSTLAGGRSRWVGTPFVPTPSGGCGAQRRARAAPLGAGTGATRTRADPPFGGEHGEHGEDLPLTRSEHRGTPVARSSVSYPQGIARVYAKDSKDSKDSRIRGF